MEPGQAGSWKIEKVVQGQPGHPLSPGAGPGQLLRFHTGRWRALGKGDSGLQPAPLNLLATLGPRSATEVTGGQASGSGLLLGRLGPDLSGRLPPSVPLRPGSHTPAGCPPARTRPPLCLARPLLLTALTLQALNSVGKGQVTERWAGVSGTSRSCWEGWTRDLKCETGPSPHGEQAEAGQPPAGTAP